MIKLILPISHVDAGLAGLLGERLIALGGLQEREILVVACWEDAHDLDIPKFCDYLRPHFKHVETYVCPDVPEGETWPAAANHMFFQSMAWAAQNGNKDPLYFFEGDNFPLRKRWLDALDAEYLKAGKPYMGVIQHSHFLDKSTGEIFQKGRHLVGTAIYSADFLERSKEVHVLTSEPWDLACASEIVPESHHTDLIAHCWNSEAFHLVEGRLIGRKKKDAEKRFGLDKVTGLPQGKEILVPKGTFVLHGCKDGSLSKCFMKGTEYVG